MEKKKTVYMVDRQDMTKEQLKDEHIGVQEKSFYIGDQQDIIDYVSMLVIDFEAAWGVKPRAIMCGANDYIALTTELLSQGHQRQPLTHTFTEFMGLPLFATESDGITLAMPDELVYRYAREIKST